eukprot:TRINITY_DN5852_c0_g1_i2.p1 TRINITY_DN5852_c0_g1~~TRINITY_DN5852_c0_g1_i2.p1  ORF type:complete len:166 (+),score=40.37 TRINITY_DN5852_c0_g1_i2:34-531(+)
MKSLILLAIVPTILAIGSPMDIENLKIIVTGVLNELGYKKEETKVLYKCFDEKPIESWNWFYDVLKITKAVDDKDAKVRLSAFVTPVVDTFGKLFECSSGEVKGLMWKIVDSSKNSGALLDKLKKNIAKTKKELEEIHGLWVKTGPEFQKMGTVIGKIIKDYFIN